MDYLLKKFKIFLRKLFYGDENINKRLFLSQIKMDFDGTSQELIDADNGVIFEEDKAEEVSLEVQKQRDIFIRLFNLTKFKM